MEIRNFPNFYKYEEIEILQKLILFRKKKLMKRYSKSFKNVKKKQPYIVTHWNSKLN